MSDKANLSTRSLLLSAVIALLCGFAGAAVWDVSGLGQGSHEARTREYLLAHPEVLPEAIQNLQKKEAQSRIAPARAQIEKAYPGAILGNPNGSVTLVEFSDYACGYCRHSVADVEKLVANNPDLRVVIREYPILAPESADAARMALAAADQGKFAPFHAAMFAEERPSAETIESAARKAGVDLEKARSAIASGKYESELGANVSIARTLGFDGTPSWVIGNNGFSGAVGHDALAQAIADAKEG